MLGSEKSANPRAGAIPLYRGEDGMYRDAAGRLFSGEVFWEGNILMGRRWRNYCPECGREVDDAG